MLVPAARKMPVVKYGSLAQGARRFWRLAGERWELAEFVARMRDKSGDFVSFAVKFLHQEVESLKE